jgi:uncharacterized NAD-dependent epimerase/dehydratase family protein
MSAALRPLPAHASVDPRASAIVYCEASFGAGDGETANGLVRHSERHDILSVIDSGQAGLDAGMVLDGEANGIPISKDLADALAQAGGTPDWFIFGMAPATGLLSVHERSILLEAMALGMNIVNGLHETFAATEVIGLTINHENMTDAEITAAVTLYQAELGIPATDALSRPTAELVSMVLAAFPEIEEPLAAGVR